MTTANYRSVHRYAVLPSCRGLNAEAEPTDKQAGTATSFEVCPSVNGPGKVEYILSPERNGYVSVCVCDKILVRKSRKIKASFAARMFC